MVHHHAETNRENHLEQQILTTEHPKHDAKAPCFFHAKIKENPYERERIY